MDHQDPHAQDMGHDGGYGDEMGYGQEHDQYGQEGHDQYSGEHDQHDPHAGADPNAQHGGMEADGDHAGDNQLVQPLVQLISQLLTGELGKNAQHQPPTHAHNRFAHDPHHSKVMAAYDQIASKSEIQIYYHSSMLIVLVS
jgi:hypothetical protein